jgi:Ca2+-binding RTX toxin-like protein
MRAHRVIVLACLLFAGISADVSRASTVDIVSPGGGDAIRYVAASGERNDLTFAGIEDTWPTAVMVSDPGASITVGRGCVSVDVHRAVCIALGGSMSDVRVKLGDGDDVLHPAESSDVRADGGPGNDRLLGGTAADRLDGGGGVDELRGNDGRDSLVDGDRDGGSTGATVDADVLDGGADYDWVSYEARRQPVAVDLSDPGTDGAKGEGDMLLGIEAVHGGKGDDRLIGDDRSNAFDDEGGDNEMFGQGGDDTFLSTRSGRVDCGDGKDALRGVNHRVSVERNCETLLRYVGDGEFTVRPYPRRTAGAMYVDMTCGGDIDGETINCSGSVTITTASRPRQTLARGAVRHGVGRRSVRLNLTALGARLLRQRAVAVTVQLHGSGMPDVQWVIVLEHGR